MEKNNLDNLFRDKLKDFKEVPDEGVWKSIEASLEKKDKRRVVPIWWKLGGIAALLAVLFYVINPFSADKSIEETIITDIRDDQTIDGKDVFENNELPANIKNDNTTEVTSINTEENEAYIEEKEKASAIKSSGNVKFLNSNSYENQNQAVVNNNKIDNSKNKAEDKPKFSTQQINETVESKRNAVAEITNKKPVIENTANTDLFKSQEQVVESNVTQKEEVEDEIKISIFDAIAEQNQDEEKEITEKSESRWAMGPSVAPVYFDAQGQGSPIHSNFASNTKSGNVNLSYGLQVSYGVSKKLSIRTGVHKVDFGYDTNDVVFSSSLQASTNDLIDNISYSQASRNLVVESKPRSDAAASDVTSSEFNATSPALEGRMVQQMGYLEVPFELNYALVDKKLGINVIGGVSSLFLVDNSVSLESEGLVTEMGQANNLNDVNFSTNIGLGFNYEFSPKVQLNLEPVFKYQLNTFSDTAGLFRPYTIGVYSGVSFKF